MNFSEIFQKLGLWLINRLSFTARRLRSTIAYGDAPRQDMDCYVHESGPENRPVVVFFYGGAWKSYSKENFGFVADCLLKMGLDVYIPNYRLYPAARFMDIYADAKSAMAVVAREVGQRPVILMGHSAGAHIASLLALKGDVPASLNLYGFVGMSGPYDYYPYTEDEHWDLFGPEEFYRESHVVRFVNPEAPPLYLLHGREDTRVRRGHSKSLMEKQVEAGGEASREVYDDMGHADLVISFSPLHRRNNVVVHDVARFIATVIAKAGTESGSMKTRSMSI